MNKKEIVLNKKEDFFLNVLLLYISNKKRKGIEFSLCLRLSSKISIFEYVETPEEILSNWPVSENRIINYALQEGFLEKYIYKDEDTCIKSIVMIAFAITEKGEDEVKKILKSFEE